MALARRTGMGRSGLVITAPLVLGRLRSRGLTPCPRTKGIEGRAVASPASAVLVAS